MSWAFDIGGRRTLEGKQVGGELRADRARLVLPDLGREAVGEGHRRAKYPGGAHHLHRLADHDHVEMEEQALRPLLIEILVVDDDDLLALERATQHLLTGVAIFLLVPVQHRAELAAIVAHGTALRAVALVDAEPPDLGVVADMARLDDDEVLAMMGIGPVAVDRDLAADPAVVEGKGAEMLGEQDNGIALALVRAERPGRHHPLPLEAQRPAVVIEPRHKLAVAHGIGADPQVLDHPLHGRLSPKCPKSRC